MQDLRHAVRVLLRRPGFTAVALTTLAVAIGANTAIFSLVHGLLLRPLPFAEPDRLVTVREHQPQRGLRAPASAAAYQVYRESGAFADLGASTSWVCNLTG